jgi:membrane-bound lytic murein transglycosylase B
MTIPRPKTTPADPDHVLDAEFALEPWFQELAEKAKASGWDEDVVTMALVGLAEAHLHMRKANGATDLAVSLARERRQQ